MKKLCGYDLNGWRDLGCRNWTVQPDGDEMEVMSSVSEGGILGVLVRIGEGKQSQLIGGAQAMLAPHGLGIGWGKIGNSVNRQRITQLLACEDPSVDGLAAALTGLFPGSGFGVASIDDVPSSNELLQERMLAALRKVRVSSPLLVWRPVLAALFAIEKGVITQPLKVGVICHAAEGFAVQQLQIRTSGDANLRILAPERRRAGQIHISKWGYRCLAERAHSALAASSSGDRHGPLEWAKSTGRLALGMPTRAELLRLDNGDWQALTPPAALDVGDLSLPAELMETLNNCDIVLLESLADGAICEGLRSKLALSAKTPIEALPPHAIAEGGLIAARRLSRREPVYFDFLPQISTIVQKREGAESYDLVDPETTLPAGEIYRSPKPAHFAIQAGQDRFSIYLHKQTADRPRKAEVEIGGKVTRQTPVDLWIEQSPASGRAKILLHSESLVRHFQVDWDVATELNETWEDLLASFEKPTPTIPARLVLPCGIDVWLDNARGDGLLKVVAAQVAREQVDWSLLANKLAARPFGRYAVSSDGDLPSEVDGKTVADLHSLIERAVKHVRDRLEGKVEGRNDSLRFLTWLYRLCPQEVAVWLLEAWDQQVRGHRLITHVSHWKLAYQGLGRIVNKRSHEQQAIYKILQKPTADWSWQRETAAMAFMLSRSDTAPKALTRKGVEHVAKRVLEEFDVNLGTTYSRFQYAPFLLVGLLRWRIVDPFALVAGQDPVADELIKRVDKTLKDLKIASRAKANAKYGRILEQVREEIEGKGTNPDLLLDIASGTEDANESADSPNT